jgi:hypothetical protein
MYNIEMSNRDRIWPLWGWNMDFWLVFIMNRRFLVKPKANTFGVLAKTWYFSKPLEIYVEHRNV